MAIRSFDVWDYVIFAICLCISAGIGVYHAFFGGGQHTTEKYYYGNRNMGALPVALSMLVTYQSSIFMLGYPGEMYIYGSMFWLSFVGVGLGFILVAVFEVPLLHPLNIRSAFEVIILISLFQLMMPDYYMQRQFCLCEKCPRDSLSMCKASNDYATLTAHFFKK
jgi:Na+/pantothenate symporter